MKLIFLGPPNVGKGTYAERVAEKLGIPHISTGDLLREEIKKGSDLGKEAQGYMDKGDLVPDELVVRLLKNRMSQPDAERGFILDGFPRNDSQAETLENEGVKIDKVVNYTSPDEVLVQRVITRRSCKKCGAIYNLVTNPPQKEGVCDKCGGDLYQRDDDTEETLRNRLEVYRKQTAPLIEYYEKKGIVVHIDGSKAITEVVEATVQALGKAGQ